MKRLLSAFVVLLILSQIIFLGVSFANSGITIGNNLLSNPNFDYAGGGWTTYDPNNYSTTYWTSEKYSGTGCMRIAPNGYSNGQQKVSLTNGQHYYFSAYMKANDKDASGGKIMFYDGSAYHTWNTTSFSIAMTEGWKKIEYYYTYTGATTANGTFIIQPMTQNGWVMLVDNAVLAPMVEITNPVTGINIDKSEITLPVGGCETLNAMVLPTDATNKTIIWSSENTNIAKVNDLGVVEAVSEGDVNIIAKAEGTNITDVCKVNVKKRNIGTNLIHNGGFEYDLDNWTEYLVTGGIDTSTSHTGESGYRFTPKEGYSHIRQTVDFYKDKYYYFSAYIKAIDNNVLNGDVVLSLADGVYPTLTSYTVNVGDGWKKVEAVYKHTTEDKKDAYFCLRPSRTPYLSVLIDDVVFAEVVDFSVPLTDISFTVSQMSVSVGFKKQLSLNFAPQNATNKEIYWSSSDKNIAVVSQSGEVLGKSEGTATITAVTVDGNITKTCVVNVTKKYLSTNLITNGDFEQGLSGWTEYLMSTSNGGINKTNTHSGSSSYKYTPTLGYSHINQKVYLRKNSIYYFSAYIKADTADLFDGDVIFSLGENNYPIFITYTVKTGNWAHIEGTYTQMGDDNDNAYLVIRPSKTAGVSAYIDDVIFAEIIKDPIYAQGVSIDKSSLILNTGEKALLTATILPSDASDKKIIWKSSDENIATVNYNGFVTAQNMGICQITATTVDGGFGVECNISVNNATLENPVILENFNNADDYLLDTSIPFVDPKSVLKISTDNNSTLAGGEKGLTITALSKGSESIDGNGYKSGSCSVNVNFDANLNKVNISGKNYISFYLNNVNSVGGFGVIPIIDGYKASLSALTFYNMSGAEIKTTTLSGEYLSIPTDFEGFVLVDIYSDEFKYLNKSAIRSFGLNLSWENIAFGQDFTYGLSLIIDDIKALTVKSEFNKDGTNYQFDTQTENRINPYLTAQTGISVEAVTNGALPQGSKLKTDYLVPTDFDEAAVLSLAKNYKIAVLYDIFLTTDGYNSVLQNDTIKLKIPVPKEYANDSTIKLCRINDNGIAEILNATNENGYFEMFTLHLCKYAIIGENIKEPSIFSYFSESMNVFTLLSQPNPVTNDNINAFVFTTLALSLIALYFIIRKRKT